MIENKNDDEKDENNFEFTFENGSSEKIDVLLKAIKNGDDEKAIEIINLMKLCSCDVSRDIILKCYHFNRGKVAQYFEQIEMSRNVENKDYFTPLMISSKNGDIEVTRFLLNLNFDMNFTTNDGRSALSQASFQSKIEIVKLLLSHGINVEKCGGQALLSAVTTSYFEIAKLLIENGANVNYVRNSSTFFTTPLHFACQKNNFEMVQLLLDNGADENIKNNDGKTPIELTESEEIKEFIRNYNSTKFVLK